MGTGVGVGMGMGMGTTMGMAEDMSMDMVTGVIMGMGTEADMGMGMGGISRGLLGECLVWSGELAGLTLVCSQGGLGIGRRRVFLDMA